MSVYLKIVPCHIFCIYFEDSSCHTFCVYLTFLKSDANTELKFNATEDSEPCRYPDTFIQLIILIWKSKFLFLLHNSSNRK